MAREIKFRGLRIDGKGWVYGYYFYERYVDEHYIIDDTSNVEVIPESVGQFTGLKDSNGVYIYVGDKITFTKGYCDDSWTDTEQGREYQVIWSEIFCGYRANRGRNFLTIMEEAQMRGKYPWTWEVVGNIHESEVTNV